jgi:hypothetical protein
MVRIDVHKLLYIGCHKSGAIGEIRCWQNTEKCRERKVAANDVFPKSGFEFVFRMTPLPALRFFITGRFTASLSPLNGNERGMDFQSKEKR